LQVERINRITIATPVRLRHRARAFRCAPRAAGAARHGVLMEIVVDLLAVVS